MDSSASVAPPRTGSNDSRPSSRHSNTSSQLNHPSQDGMFRKPAPPQFNFNGQAVHARTQSPSPLQSPFPNLRGDPGPTTSHHRSTSTSSPVSSTWPALPGQFHSGGARHSPMSDRSMPPPGADHRAHSMPLATACKGKGKLLVEGMVADEVLQLQNHLKEIVDLTHHYAGSEGKDQEAPPDALLRLNTLATLIHRSLQSLQPQVNQSLHPTFKLTSPPKRTRTAAERDMETIRVRRDALIAKAAAAAAISSTNLTSTAPASESKQELPEWYPLQRPGMWTSKCHSCGTAETVNWRAGPDGPGSLCDTCGTHYAKLTRNGPLVSPTEAPLQEQQHSYINPYPQLHNGHNGQ